MDLGFEKKSFKCKAADYCFGDAIHLSDSKLHARSQEYKRKLSGRMKPISGQDLHRIPSARGYYVTRKYDGEFALLFFDGKDVMSVNPGGTARVGLPAYEEAAKLLKAAKVKSCVVAIEIYRPDATSSAQAIQQVVGLLRNPKSEAELKKLSVAVFDVAEHDGKAVSTSKQTFSLLEKWFGKGKLIHPAEHVVTDSKDTILEKLTDWVIGEESEGLVVRHDLAGWFKVKLRHNFDAAIIGFSVGEEERKTMLHDLLVAVMRPDGTFHELARVGGGFTDKDRKDLAHELKRRIVPSDYVAVNNDYVAYEMVAPGPVIEISCLDLITERARGGPINKMVLDWDGKRYSALSRMPLVSVISPQFVRVRDDKEAIVEDVNIRQLSELVPIIGADKPAVELTSNPSKLLERVVYTKTMRGNQMVRKLLLWKTNKDDQPDYPPYVVYLTDFSPNRQTPLEREIRIATNEKTARKQFKTLAEEYFVSGWEKVDGAK
jgi:ATP-dependent DNA ligase